MGSGCSSIGEGVVAGLKRLPSLPIIRRHSGLALWERAVPLQFLEYLVELKPFPKVSPRKLGDLFTREVVSEFIKPLTAKSKLCYIEALREGHVRLPWTTVDEDTGLVRFAVGGAPAVAKSSFFVSHAWSYRFKDLVQLIKQHAEMEGNSSGTAYWLDILAVTQNFSGKFENHIDGDFGSVIRESQGLLLTIHPFVQPKAPTRVWCLYEVVNAIQQGKPMDLVMDPMFGKTRAYDPKISLTEVALNFEKSVIACLDVNNSDATVQADKIRILDLVRQQPGGIPKFNEQLKTAMRSAVKDALLLEAVYCGDVASAESFIKVGAKIRCSSVAPPAGQLSNAAKVLAAVLSSGSQIQGIHLIGANSPAGALPEATSKTLLKLMDAIDSSGGVTALSLARLGMSDVEAAMIARSVAKINCPLKYLDISGNNLGEEGVEALMHGFADNHSRTGSLTKILIDMPKGGGRDRDRLRIALCASNPFVVWVGGKVVGGAGAAAAAVKDTGPLGLAAGVTLSGGQVTVDVVALPTVQTARAGSVIVPPPVAILPTSLSTTSIGSSPTSSKGGASPPMSAKSQTGATATSGKSASGVSPLSKPVARAGNARTLAPIPAQRAPSQGLMAGMMCGIGKLGASIVSVMPTPATSRPALSTSRGGTTVTRPASSKSAAGGGGAKVAPAKAVAASPSKKAAPK